MKIAFVYTPGRAFWSYVYRKYSWLQNAEYDVQLGVFLDEPYSFHSGWQPVFAGRGYECATFLPGVDPLENAWLRENGEPAHQAPGPWKVAMEQLARFQPDIIYNSVSNQYGARFFEAIRATVPSLKALVGYAGSFTFDTERLKTQDAVVTCSTEIRDTMAQQGLRAFYVPHAFDTSVNRLLGDLPTPKVGKVVFSGNIIRRKGVHSERENLLSAVATRLPLAVYTPLSRHTSISETLRSSLVSGASESARLLLKTPIVGPFADRIYGVRRAARLEVVAGRLSRQLKAILRPPVFGLDAFRLYKAYAVTLNHSGEYQTAENVRLFEATGAGACLLTDWKDNLSRYFEIDSEIVTYKSADECIEKAQWLLLHPQEADRIGEAAMKRTNSCHSFENRIDALEGALRLVAE